MIPLNIFLKKSLSANFSKNYYIGHNFYQILYVNQRQFIAA